MNLNGQPLPPTKISKTGLAPWEGSNGERRNGEVHASDRPLTPTKNRARFPGAFSFQWDMQDQWRPSNEWSYIALLVISAACARGHGASAYRLIPCRRVGSIKTVGRPKMSVAKGGVSYQRNYRNLGIFRVKKFSCKKFSCWKIFVRADRLRKFFNNEKFSRACITVELANHAYDTGN